jgi:integrase
MGTLRVILGERDLSINPDSQIIIARPTVGKERFTKTTGIRATSVKYIDHDGFQKAIIPEEDLKKARTVLRKKILPEITHGKRKYAGKLVIDEMPLWITDQAKRWGEGTTSDCQSRWKIVEQFLTSKDSRNVSIYDFNAGVWDDFKTWVAENHPEIGTLGGIRKYLSMFLLFKFRKGEIPNQVKLTIPKEDAAPAYILKDRELLRAIRYARKVMNDEQLEFIIWLGWLTGIRPDEYLYLKKDRVDWVDFYFKLRKEDVKKNTPPRDVPFFPEHRRYRRFVELLKARTKSKDSIYLIPRRSDPMKPQSLNGIQKAWKKCFSSFGLYDLQDAAGLRVTPYDLRHTCATNMPRFKVDPIHACKILGTSLEMYYSRYCKPKKEDTRAAMARGLGLKK